MDVRPSQWTPIDPHRLEHNITDRMCVVKAIQLDPQRVGSRADILERHPPGASLLLVASPDKSADPQERSRVAAS